MLTNGDSPALRGCTQLSQVSGTPIYFSDLILELKAGE